MRTASPASISARISGIGSGRTGVTINDVPQYEICLEVQPVAGEPFLSSVTELLTAPESADLRPVGCSPSNTDRTHPIASRWPIRARPRSSR